MTKPLNCEEKVLRNKVKANIPNYDSLLETLLESTSNRSRMIHFYPGAGEYAPSKAVAGKII